jgi:hypothetical protein
MIMEKRFAIVSVGLSNDVAFEVLDLSSSVQQVFFGGNFPFVRNERESGPFIKVKTERMLD